MRKELILVFLILLSFDAFADEINVPGDYATIQEAIDHANPGDIINVVSGTYTEDLVIPEGKDNLEIKGAGQDVTTIKGVATSGAPNIQIHTVDGIKIHGFTIESPDVFYTSPGGIIFSGENIEIYDNIFISNFQVNEAYTIVMQTYRSQYVGDPWFLWKEHDISGLSIHDNTFESRGVESVNGYIGVWINRDSGSGTVTIEDNSFSGNIRWGIATERSNMLIQNNIVDSTNGLRVGIGVMDWGDSSGYDPEDYGGLPRPQNNIQIINNIIRGFSNADWAGIVIGVPGENQELTNIVLNENTIQDNYKGIIVSSSADGVEINYNDIIGNSFGLQNDDSDLLNAEYNWWGDCTGPGYVGPGSGDNVTANVDYEPWLGVCIENKTEVSCAFPYDDIVLEAYLTNIETVKDAWIEIEINGVRTNRTEVNIMDDRCSYVIDSSELEGGETVGWNYHIEDNYNHIFNNSWKEFYVREKTKLEVEPEEPNGLSGWYVVEPIFSLIKDSLGDKIYYMWDSTGPMLYEGVFGLDEIPNPSKESAGILELSWWSDFDACGNETEQSQTFYVDLTKPNVTNVYPEQGMIIDFTDFTIYAYLEEWYQSNSGIDRFKLEMELDGSPVTPLYYSVGEVDAEIEYDVSGLNEGLHEVWVNVTDNAGNNNEFSWDFTIDTSYFTIDIVQPDESFFTSKRVPVKIELSKEVDELQMSDNEKKYKKLCKDCSSFDSKRTFKDGFHNVSFRAVKNGVVKYGNAQFIVDSKDPKIKKIYPTKYSNGTFRVDYNEDSLKRVTLHVEQNENEINFTRTDCESGKKKSCEINMSLDEGKLVYWFEIEDVAGNTDKSRKKRVTYDSIAPDFVNIVNPVNNTVYDGKVKFEIHLDEKATVEYTDQKERWKILGKNKDYVKKSKGYREGNYTVSLRISDKAENSRIVSFEVEVV